MKKLFTIICVFALLLTCVGCAKDFENGSELDNYKEIVEEVVPTPEPEPILYERYTEVPHLFQTDFPYSPYGKHGSVSTHGCGITCIAMVASYLLDTEVSPRILAEKFGQYNTENGSSWSVFEKTAPHIGITMEGQVNSRNEAIKALEEGKVVIACAKSNSIFTDGGHFIVLTGLTEDGKVTVNDPYRGNYMKSSHKALRDGFENGFTKEELNGCGPFWIYSAKDETVIKNTTEVKSISYEIVKKEGQIPYYLYTPSTINDEEATPIIIWLHDFWGSVLGEIGFTNSELPKELQGWMLEEPNAYIVCPQMNHRDWCTNNRIKQLNAIIDDMTTNYNIDTNKIIIMGQGTGGEGAVYFANQLSDTFSAAVAFGPYNRSYIKISDTSIPLKVFVGTKEDGAAPETTTFVKTRIKPNYEDGTVKVKEGAAHAEIVGRVFGEDVDGNSQSDIIEWALGQSIKDRGAVTESDDALS